METKELKIEGMTCNHCTEAVKRALLSVAGVENAKVSLENKNAFVEYDPGVTNTDALIEAVVKTGYKAE